MRYDLDEMNQTRLLAQQLASKDKYRQLVTYIGELKKMEKLAKLNTLIKQEIIVETPAIRYYKARLEEQAKAYFMAERASELTILGLMVGDTSKRLKTRGAVSNQPVTDPVP